MFTFKTETVKRALREMRADNVPQETYSAAFDACEQDADGKTMHIKETGMGADALVRRCAEIEK